MWVSRTTKSSSVALGTTPLQSLCSLTKHMSPEMVPASADSNYMSVVLRASEGTTVVMKQSPMWDQQNVCTGWWHMHQQSSRSPLPCGSLHWSTRVNHFSIIPRHAHCNQCYRWMCPCALGSYMWTDEHHHVRTPLQFILFEESDEELGTRNGKVNGCLSSLVERTLPRPQLSQQEIFLWQQKNYKFYPILRWRILYTEGKPS